MQAELREVDLREKPLLLRHMRFKIQEPKIQAEAGEDADVIHRICCPSGLFSSMLLVIITLTLQILKKNVTLSRVIVIITREFYTMENGFKLLGDNIKVFY